MKRANFPGRKEARRIGAEKGDPIRYIHVYEAADGNVKNRMTAARAVRTKKRRAP